MRVSRWCLLQEMLSFRTSTFANEPSISGFSAVHIATSPPRSSGQLHEKSSGKGISAAVCLGVRGAAISQRHRVLFLWSFFAHPSRSFAPPRLLSLAKYSTKWAGHGHVVLMVVTADTVFPKLEYLPANQVSHALLPFPPSTPLFLSYGALQGRGRAWPLRATTYKGLRWGSLTRDDVFSTPISTNQTSFSGSSTFPMIDLFASRRTVYKPNGGGSAWVPWGWCSQEVERARFLHCL